MSMAIASAKKKNTKKNLPAKKTEKWRWAASDKSNAMFRKEKERGKDSEREEGEKNAESV